MVRAAYTLHAEDDDYGQANTLINEVMDDAQRERLVANVAGALRGVKRQEVLARAFEYWRNIDTIIGDKVRTATNLSNPPAGTVGTSRTAKREMSGLTVEPVTWFGDATPRTVFPIPAVRDLSSS